MDPDPLRITADLGLDAEFHPLGFRIRLATNCAEIIAAAEASWGHFRSAFAEPAIDLHVLVEPGTGPPQPPEPPLFRARRHLITIASGDDLAVCDHQRRFAFCRLSSTTAADPAFVRYYFLEAMVLFILTQLYVTPIHGACIARNGRALLLCGNSGAGKSTLAYACARRGWTYISDNETWLLRADARTILGNPRQIRLRDSAPDLFPELAGRPSILFNGKRSILLDTGNLDIAFQCQPEKIIFLKRTSRTATLRPVDSASEILLAEIIQYSAEVREAHRDSLERFARIPAMELQYRDLEHAIPALEGLLG